MNTRHFIRIRDIPLLYGRVPKVANSSIKAALCRLLETTRIENVRTTSDNFWRTGTQGETSMLTTHDALMCRGTHFSFSFVRNPFDRLVSAYNNKLIENDEISGPMKAMGLVHSMPFGSCLDVVESTSDDELDIHLLPQSTILCHERQLVPNFVGCLETMYQDWSDLQPILRREGIPDLGALPEKNVRRSLDYRDVADYFKDPGLVRIVSKRYGDDLECFYGHKTTEQLIKGE